MDRRMSWILAIGSLATLLAWPSVPPHPARAAEGIGDAAGPLRISISSSTRVA